MGNSFWGSQTKGCRPTKPLQTAALKGGSTKSLRARSIRTREKASGWLGKRTCLRREGSLAHSVDEIGNFVLGRGGCPGAEGSGAKPKPKAAAAKSLQESCYKTSTRPNQTLLQNLCKSTIQCETKSRAAALKGGSTKTEPKTANYKVSTRVSFSRVESRVWRRDCGDVSRLGMKLSMDSRLDSRISLCARDSSRCKGRYLRRRRHCAKCDRKTCIARVVFQSARGIRRRYVV
jgi:hypothetical protein